MKWFKNNGLSVVFFVLFVVSMMGQVVTGLQEHNQEVKELGGKEVSVGEYLTTGHFLQSTFENWESEFLQMALFVVLTMCLFQKGSSESKDPEGDNAVDRPIDPKRKGAPWPVRRGGWVLLLYKNSLSLLLTLIFILSFLLHWHGSQMDFNEEQALKGQPQETMMQYLSNSRLWFESFQNWQSEFLSVFAIVLFSVFLRQKGSAQSKPVDAPDGETGE
ncbi:MAG: hypothetical protein JWP88_1007 [Flaviaesturariibacter sp.]|nr:hypothetical protein [Flaviaesturariibacter sp.]